MTNLLLDLESKFAESKLMRELDEAFSEADEIIVDLMRKLDEACSNADEIIAHIQQLLDESPSRPERIEFLQAVREIRNQRAQALLAARRIKQLSAPPGDEQRREESLFIRKAILAIRLQVTRLAGILEALLEPRHQ
jgi:DNA-binding SARP family transcriptional activator